MATKTLNTRIQLKYDTLSNWSTNNPELLKGELAIVYLGNTVDVNKPDPDNGTHPILFKVGPGNFNSLPFASALAADVYAWAKKAAPDWTDFPEIPGVKLGLKVTTTGTGPVVTNVAYDSATKTITVTKGTISYSDLTGTPDINDAPLTLEAGAGLSATKTVFTANDADAQTFIVSHGAKPTSGTKHATTNGSGRTYVTEIEVDAFGHIAGVKTATEVDQDLTHNHDGQYKKLQQAKSGTLAGAQVVGTWAQDEQGVVSITPRTLTPADIGAQPAGSYQPVGNYKIKQDEVSKTGATNKTVTSVKQNENGDITEVKFEDIAITSTQITDLADVVEDLTITCEHDDENTPQGLIKRHTIKQGDAVVCTIDIPKDLVVSSGTVETVTEENKPYAGAKVGDKYIELVIANQTEHLYIPANSLVDVYTAAAGATEVQVAISDKNVVSATLVNGGVAKAKLATSVQTSLGLADTALQAADKTELSNAISNLAGTGRTTETVKTNADAIAAINNTTTGILATAKKYADTKVQALDATVTGMGAGKTIKTLTETDGVIAATFQDIAITKTQITDFSDDDYAKPSDLNNTIVSVERRLDTSRIPDVGTDGYIEETDVDFVDTPLYITTKNGVETLTDTHALAGGEGIQLSISASGLDNTTTTIRVADKGITTAKIADRAVGAEQTKAYRKADGTSEEVWVFNCGSATELV